MHVFAVAVNERNMTDFRDYVAYSWQHEITPERLDEAFGAFYDSGLDLTALDRMRPQFDGPGVLDDDGILLIAGHYPTRPSQVTFEHGYIYEGLSWKLVQFMVDVKPVK